MRTYPFRRSSKAEGKTFGRPSALTEAQRATVMDQLKSGVAIAQIAREMHTSRQTIMRVRESMSLMEPDFTGIGPDGVPYAMTDWSDRRKSRDA
ncbi:hypothetical protein NLI96_g12677 [Meripilus lineatus]|uniref:Resolvase HTH domain-containing protein n=1 Tax=Meripilus lineatus TaxID=2056292 RepID=A0AAD5UPD6_9APHY|nr:hypothetical protein NLI96_g12677 [Physisporinus lineatus]